MKSRKACYDCAISHVTVKRFAPVCILYTVGMLLLTIGMVNSSENLNDGVIGIRGLCGLVTVCNLIYAAMLAQLLLGDLYAPRLSYALHSLPVTLGGWFGTQVILGILSVIPGTSLCTGIILLRLAEFRVVCLIYAGTCILSFLFFFGTALLSGVCAGNRIGMLLIYGIIQFAGLFYGWAKLTIFSPLVYGIFFPNYSASASPIVAMQTRDPFTVVYRDIPNGEDVRTVFGDVTIDHLEFTGYLWIMLAFAVAGCILIGLALYLLRRRKPECAGDLLAFRAMEPVLLVLCSLLCGVLFHAISDVFGWTIGYPMLFIGMIVGYYAMLMLLRRQSRVFTKKSLLPLALILVISLGSITATGLNLFGITYRIPDASQIAQVKLSMQPDETELISSAPEDIELALRVQRECLERHRQVESSRPLPERIFGSEEGCPRLDENEECGMVSITYTMKNGSTVGRMYYICRSFECIAPLRELFSKPEYVLPFRDEGGKFDAQLLLDRLQGVQLDCWHGSDDEITENSTMRIRDSDVPGLIEAILRDCEEGTMAQPWILREGKVNVSIAFFCTLPTISYSRVHQLNIRPENTNTLSYLISQGYHAPTQ